MSVVFVLPESVRARFVSLFVNFANDGSDGDSTIWFGIVPFGSFCWAFFCRSLLLDGLKALSRFLLIKLGVRLKGISDKSILGCVMAIAGVWLTLTEATGETVFDTVGCFVIGILLEGTTAGGDSETLVCCPVFVDDVSNLFLGDVGDWLYEH